MSNIIRQDTTDWAAFYTTLQAKANVPYIFNTSTKTLRYVYRKLVVNISDLLVEIDNLPKKPGIIFIVADVVHMPREWDLNNQAIIIITRRVVYNTPISGSILNFDLNKDNRASFTLFANEIVGQHDLTAIQKYSGGNKHIFVREYPGIGIQFKRGTNGHLKLIDLANKDLLPYTSGKPNEQVTEEIEMSLSNLFQLASYIPETNRNVVESLLNWIKTASANSIPLQDLYIQASSLLVEFNAEAGRANYTPALSPAVYETMAKSFLDAVKLYEEQYQLFKSDRTSKEDQIKAAELMLTHYKASTAFTEALIKQAENNEDAAKATLKKAEENMQDASFRSGIAGRDFDYGLRVWEHDQKLKAAFEICGAVVTFGVAIGKLYMGDPTSTVDAGKAVTDASKAAAQAAKETSALMKTLKEMADAMGGLKKMGDFASGVYKFAESIKNAAEKIISADKIGDIDIPKTDFISAEAEWDIFRLKSNDMMAQVEEASIGGAQAYRQSLEIIAIYGKAQSAAQAALVLATQEVARLYMERAVNVQMEEAVKAYIADMKSGGKLAEKAMFDAYVLQLNMKRYMYHAIKNYERAYKYWALRDSIVKPSMEKTTTQLQDDVARMKQNYFDALMNFSPIPQEFGGQEKGINIEITNPQVLKAFKENGVANIEIGLNNEQFEWMNRVRITGVRVWLYGVPNGTKVSLSINNSGMFRDRYNRTDFTFAGRSTSLAFQYDEEPGNPKGIKIDGKITPEFAEAYFQPTPFSTWQISLPERDKKKPEFANVSKIVISFSGSSIVNIKRDHKLKPIE